MKTETPAVLTILLALLFVFASCSKDKPESDTDSGALERAKALHTMATPSYEFPGAKNGAAIPGMIDIGRGKCVPCKKMEPILKELKQAYAGKAVIEIINLDDQADAADRYNLRMIPTQIFFDAAGSEVWRHEGFLSRDAIVEKFTEMGVDLAGVEPAGVEPVDD